MTGVRDALWRNKVGRSSQIEAQHKLIFVDYFSECNPSHRIIKTEQGPQFNQNPSVHFATPLQVVLHEALTMLSPEA